MIPGTIRYLERRKWFLPASRSSLKPLGPRGKAKHLSFRTRFFTDKFGKQSLRWRRMIRNCVFRYQSLDFFYFRDKIKDSGHFQLALLVYTVFHAESESAVRIDKFLHPEEKVKKNQPMRVSISYRKTYYMYPPYYILLINPFFGDPPGQMADGSGPCRVGAVLYGP